MIAGSQPLRPRVALVTGCAKAGGIGETTARALSASGATVVVSDIEPRQGAANRGASLTERYRRLGLDPSWGGLESLVGTIDAAGGEASYVVGDVSDEADAARMVRETVDRHGRLDILVNNAAAPQGADRADVERVPLEAWEQVMAVNLRGTFLMSRAAIPFMREARFGRIVNVASHVARQAYPEMTAYTASKAGILGLTLALAQDVAPWGITVNAVCPGATRTTRLVDAPGRPEDVAAEIVFLCGEAAASVTGQARNVGMPRGLLARLRNPMDLPSDCPPSCWCRRTAVGRLLGWHVPREYHRPRRRD